MKIINSLIDNSNLSVTAICYSCFILISIIELIFAFLAKEKGRKIVKLFCLIPLLILSILIYRNEPFYYLYILSIVMAIIGDFFLLFKSRRGALLIGGLSFLASHLLYVATFCMIERVNFANLRLFIGTVFVLASALFGYLFFLVSKKSAFYSMAGGLYFGFVCIYIGLGIYLLTLGIYLTGFLVLLGGLIFLLSDLLIGVFMFNKIKSKRPDFYIMLTYLIAIGLLSLGVLFI